METVLRFISDRKILLLLDNCEHLLDVCGETITTLLNGCPRLTILATSRETVSVAGEVTWRVPSLSVHEEAVSLFIDRARRARPTFRPAGEDADLVADICRRLDGMPLGDRTGGGAGARACRCGRSPTASTTGSGYSPAAPGTRCGASRPCAPPWTGLTRC